MKREDLWTWAAETKFRGAAWKVGLMLACHADPAGDSWPSVGRLTRETHLSRRAVQRALRELEAAGELVTVSRKGDVSVYHLDWTRGVETAGGIQTAGDKKSARGRSGGAQGAVPRPPRSVLSVGSGSPRSKGAAAPPQAAAAPVFTDDRGTFAKGSGWLDKTSRCVTCSDLSPGDYEHGVTRCPSCGQGWVPAAGGGSADE